MAIYVGKQMFIQLSLLSLVACNDINGITKAACNNVNLLFRDPYILSYMYEYIEHVTNVVLVMLKIVKKLIFLHRLFFSILSDKQYFFFCFF